MRIAGYGHSAMKRSATKLIVPEKGKAIEV
jgi:hypothetical protein